MAPAPSLKLNLQIPYRGGEKTWSMRMHFTGTLPPDGTHWGAFATALWNELQPGIRNDCELMTVQGYADDTSPAVFTQTRDQFGTFNPFGTEEQSAYVAALLKWTTDARNSRGGPIGLRNFVHGVSVAGGDLDAVNADQLAALEAFAVRFSDAGAGFSDGTTVHKRCGPNGAVGLVGSCRSFVSHRVLARRG